MVGMYSDLKIKIYAYKFHLEHKIIKNNKTQILT